MLRFDRRRFLIGASSFGAAVACSQPASADPGVSAEKILFGQAAVFEGPANALGIGMRDGLTAAFAEANMKGGVRGRTPSYTSLF
jgi:branched-chain amino acid transport system substrate-binding protein